MPQTPRNALSQKFNHIYSLAIQPAFLDMEALGGEVPFFISTHDPREQVAVATEIQSLANRLKAHGIEVLIIDLYDLCVDLLQKRGIWEQIISQEPQHPKARFMRIMQPPLNSADHLAPAIAQALEAHEYHLVFLTGVGMVFPFVRSHTILNNLQSVITRVPTIMFFPGDYDGTQLALFGRMKDDNYYRAFNLDQFHL